MMVSNDMKVLPAPMQILDMRNALIADLYFSGWSVTDIAEIFNIDKSWVSKIIGKLKNKK